MKSIADLEPSQENNRTRTGRWLITGSGGMLGRDLLASLTTNGANVVGLTRQELDITDEAAVCAALRDCKPDVVVNCAAWTAIDAAEANEGEALGVNGRGAANLAAACVAGYGTSETRLVHVSTDYVFAGDRRRPYAEHDPAAPRSAYGRSKLAGEQAVLRLLPRAGYVVRTAWLYGAHGRNFVSTMIRMEREQPTVDVVDDQRGQPTWTMDVARQIVALVRSRAAAGIYHATSSGEATWLEVAREVFRLLGANTARVRATPGGACRRGAPRPPYTVLGHDSWAAIGLEPIGDWRLSLREAFPLLASTRPAGEHVSVPRQLRPSPTEHQFQMDLER
jgi:dTDP-4-dehydrorhamnose reductase